MTNHRAGKTNTRDSRPWRSGKAEKGDTARFLRRRATELVRNLRREGVEPMGHVECVTMPHCDAKVLHAPGECKYCDEHPEWQDLRGLWGINFTGESNPNLLPCPSEVERPLDLINRWPGNRAAKP